MGDSVAGDFVLGIDLGTNSVGWAMIGLVDGEPAKLIRAGVRVFEAGMDGDLESGQEESRNLKRREARLHRRQLRRRRRRLVKLAHALQRMGLLPPGDVSDPEARQEFFNRLDAEVLRSPWFAAKKESGPYPDPLHVMPYVLRATALDEALPPHYLGRAIYHLAQRRGFLSNRKAPPKKDEKPGEVEKGITELRESMAKAGARTLGEYFGQVNPFEKRIRQRWTHRTMYEDEFNRIWEAQAPHHPQILTPERRKELYSVLFYQRPLWFPRGLVGTCELEPGEPRAPRSSFVAQRFRLLQAVNNLRLELPDGSQRGLTPEEGTTLAQDLELKGDRTFAQARKLLKLKDARFSIERGGEKRLLGNHTTEKFYSVFGERWLEMSAEEHEQAYHDVLSIQKDDALRRRGVNHWKLDEESAKKFAKIHLEPDYFNLSRKAVDRLLPHLETGVTYAEARHQLYPEQFRTHAPLDSLPCLDADETRRAVGEIRNPAVTRSLTELRKVVNSIVRTYGKPAHVRIELARDLKRSKKDRQSLTQRNRDNEDARARMKKKILEEADLNTDSRTDIRKALLHEECGGICPYTGKPIDFRHLFGPESQFDIEHIIPYERCFDNSFSNLTLCDNHENRHVKGKRTPWEAYHADEARYEEILDRVKRFRSPSAHSKLWRFQMTETEATEFVSKFIDRQLNDTRYVSKLAAKYVAMLYGGLSDKQHSRRVHVTSGEVTAQLRRSWLLNRILNDGPTAAGGDVPKTRDDHRHHAVDAVAIALTDDSTIQQLSRAAERARDLGQRKLASLEGPWPNFVDFVRGEIERIVVSHRVSKKVSGALHEETIYSRPFPVAPVYDRRQGNRRSQSGATAPTAATEVRVRKPLNRLTKPELDEIADEGVKKLVLEKLKELGGDPKKFPAPDERQNLDRFPCHVTVDGRRIPIKRVRLNNAEKPMVLGQGRTQRHVISGNNHHVEIYAELGQDGSEKEWGGEVVPMQEAYQRLKAKKPVVQRDHGPLVEFKFSLAKGDTLELQEGYGQKALFVVRKIGPQVSLIPINDARRIEKYFSPRINGLFKRHARKVTVSPLGEVSESHE